MCQVAGIPESVVCPYLCDAGRKADIDIGSVAGRRSVAHT